jgi:Galactose oxidase, central domain
MQYKPFSLSWKYPQTKGDPPQSRHGHSAIRYQNSMIVFAGEDNETEKTLNDVHILDLESWTWEQPQVSGKIPESRSFHTAVLYQEQMVVWGGYSERIEGGFICNDTAIYILDLKTWHWSRIIADGTPPVARSHYSAVVFDVNMITTYIFLKICTINKPRVKGMHFIHPLNKFNI